MKHLETVLVQQRKDAAAVEKKLATVRARVKKARERAQTTQTKASENALIKARSDASELNQRINELRDEVRETRRKLKREKLLYSIVEAEQKAEQWLKATREKLDAQAEEQLEKARARFEAGWLKKKATQIDRQLRQAEKTASTRVAAVEKKVLAQVKVLEKQAEPAAEPAASKAAEPAAETATKPVPGRGRPRKTAQTPAKAAPKAPARARTATRKAAATKAPAESVAKAAPRRRGRPPKAATTE